MSARRTLVWSGVEEWLAEHVAIELGDDGLRARGVQLGTEGEPYRAEYELVAEGDWVTQTLVVEVTAPSGVRRLELTREDMGEALDCDLAFSPLTNLMPVRRHRLHEQPGAVDFTMAWVSLPDLEVTSSEQHYEHLRPGVVRYSSGDFTADLELDADGLVVFYPRLARRVGEA